MHGDANYKRLLVQKQVAVPSAVVSPPAYATRRGSHAAEAPVRQQRRRAAGASAPSLHRYGALRLRCGRLETFEPESDVPVHVLHLIPTLGVGGAERLLTDLASRQAELNYEVSVVAISGSGRFETDLRQSASLEVWNHRGNWWNPTSHLRLTHLVRDRAVDIVHGWTLQPNMLALIVQRLVAVPAVFGHHRIYDASDIALASGQLMRRAKGRHVCVSKAVARSLESVAGVPSSQVDVVYNGVNVARISSESLNSRPVRADDSAVVIGALARLERRKGLDRLIGAAARLREHLGRDVEVFVAGRATRELDSEVLLRWASLANVTLTHVEDATMAEFMTSIDLYVQTSDAEGFGLGVLEAMACGVPVVATAVGGLVEFVPRLGLVEADVESIAKRCAELLAQPRALLAHAGSCKRAAAAFSVERMAREYEAVYRKAAVPRRGS